ncbi:hypothetical protein ACSW9O_15465 (plasmid) [Clostridium perfringens]
MKKEEIIKYIESEKEKLDKGEVENINLKFVNPSLIEEVFGDMENLELNGWESDYWFNNDKYRVFGCMYYGTANISLTQDNI